MVLPQNEVEPIEVPRGLDLSPPLAMEAIDDHNIDDAMPEAEPDSFMIPDELMPQSNLPTPSTFQGGAISDGQVFVDNNSPAFVLPDSSKKRKRKPLFDNKTMLSTRELTNPPGRIFRKKKVFLYFGTERKPFFVSPC
ncbi:uncharacterized protein [Phaseolus vulgaris]|uniref:uncharacterized protein isoform X2 n=1 Tax=Phaseolus vulgaris TaxID=3885 RepID=UPI0035CAB277